MKNRRAIAIAALLLGTALGAGLWQGVHKARVGERRAAWLQFVRGPLPLYVRGSRGGAELLAAKKFNSKNLAALADADKDLADAWTTAQTEQADYEGDAYLNDLADVPFWFGAASQLADNWLKIDRNNSGIMETARQAAIGIHRNIVLRVRSQWRLLDEDLDWSPAERVEIQKTVSALAENLPHENDPPPPVIHPKKEATHSVRKGKRERS
jgi:hypothetical protein